MKNFEILRCGPDSHLKTSTVLHTGGGKTIPPSPVVKCLGVHLNEDANYKHHIRMTVSKAKQMAGWALRTFRSRDRETMITLWKALIQPVLDYCSQLWSPHKKGDIQELESTQVFYQANRWYAGPHLLGTFRKVGPVFTAEEAREVSGHKQLEDTGTTSTKSNHIIFTSDMIQ